MLHGLILPHILQNGDQPLHTAIQEKHIDVCKLLIGAGADINALNKVVDLIAS